MRRFLIPVAILLFVAACGPAPSPTPEAEAPDVPAAPAAVQLPAGGIFAYSYEPGSSYTYGFRLTQTMDIAFDAEGDQTLFDGEEAPPERVEADVAIAGTITYAVDPGPQPDTYEINVTGTFDEMSVTGTIDGQPMPDDMDLSETGAPDLVEVPNVTIIIDSQGNLIEGEIDGEPLPSLDVFEDPFSSFEGITSGGLNEHFGPAFPEGPLEVGDSWSHSVTEDVMDQTFTAESTFTVTGVETLHGAEVAVINTTRSFSGLTIDLAEMFMALFAGFAEMSEDPNAGAELTEQLDFTFLISLAPSAGTGTVWFDPAAGVTRKILQDTSVGMDMDFAMDDGTQAGSMKMDMTFDISFEAELEA